MGSICSVITCIRNQRLDYFEDCIQSILQQDGPLEWIIVDDGSDSVLFERYKDRINDLRCSVKCVLVRLNRGVGLARARNVGFKIATGDWVAVLDSDDCLGPNVVETLRKSSSDILLSCFSTFFFDAQRTEFRPIERWRSMFYRYGLTILDPFLWFDFYYHGIVAARRLIESIGGYTSELRVGEDQDILLRATRAAGIERVMFVDDVGYYYRNNNAGVCATMWDEVVENYCATMLAEARRRGANFTECRFDRVKCLDGAKIDVYAYKSDSKWLLWEDAWQGQVDIDNI